MTDVTKTRSRRFMTIAVLGVTGLAAISSAVYVIGGVNGNVLPGSGACQAALSAGEAGKAAAAGEVAAFLPAKQPLSVADLSFQDADGTTHKIADFKDKTLLLNLWATWCAPCRKEMPALDRLQAERGGEDFAVLAINVDRGPLDKPKKFLEDIGTESLKLYADNTMGIFNELRTRGRAAGLPTTMLIDGKGCEIGSMYGPAEWASDDAKSLIDAVVKAQDKPA
ncbi:redoxin family protein [Stappia sp. GBMRC 2046]|uniref:Redoxin family protein n=1 Tax=Stappia sediminis TaxID=2692190 RepID=A0A7X3LTK6_9HYPH|nr:TlpA disulfide reductase family protein [Stappia sediminis]MXN64852.1 redoxin family protein [Stappia sediminis]